MPSPTVNCAAEYDCGADGCPEIDGGDVGYIQHYVSKYDTLAGVAIKYGVEVADIKKMNGLVTDLQMFALQSLRIPLPGRHPPSPSLSNGSTSHTGLDFATPQRQLRSPQHKMSSSTNSLHKFYRLKPPTTKCGGTEVGGYKMRKSYEISTTSRNDFRLEKSCLPVPSGDLRLMESEFEVGWETPEKVLREENDISSYSSYSSITGKSLALRPKSGSRGTLTSDDSGWLSSSSSSGDSPTADIPAKVHKSFSLSSMPDLSQTSFSSFWSNTKWNTSSLTKPLIEGLPIVARKIKAALD